MTTNGFPEGDVLRESLAEWQDRERELLARNTELVEKSRIALITHRTELEAEKYVAQKALEFGAQQEKKLQALEKAAREALRWWHCPWSIRCDHPDWAEGKQLCESCIARKHLAEVLNEGKTKT